MEDKSEKIKSQFISETYLKTLEEAILNKEKIVDISKRTGDKIAKFTRSAGVKAKYAGIRANMSKRNLMDRFKANSIKDKTEKQTALNKIRDNFNRSKDAVADSQKKELERLQKVYQSRKTAATPI